MKWEISRKHNGEWQYLCTCFDREGLGITAAGLHDAGFELEIVEYAPPASTEAGITVIVDKWSQGVKR